MATRQQARIEVRVALKQKQLFEQAAEMQGVTLTDFAISSMQRAAAEAVEEHSRIELSQHDQRAFVEALMKPPEPNAALRAVAKAYRRMK
jgi:uncharacterized protein (DUF1778 family)